MECNKDEAVRAREIAETRMQSGDFVAALKFAMKAKKMYAEVENIAKILTVCEVHSAARNKLSGSDMDWYGILQIERLADEAMIKKQYRKLALLLHPDKNKLAGAEAAFKLIGEANRVLSDRAKRSSYDMKCGVSLRTAVSKTAPHHSNGNAFAAKHNRNTKNCQKNSFSKSSFWKESFTAHDLGCQGVPSVNTSTSFYNQKEAPKHGPPKPASEGNDGKPLGGDHADSFVRSYPVSMKKCAVGVGRQCKGEKSKDGHIARGEAKGTVPASKAMESKTSTNVGSKRVRQSAPDLKESFIAGNGDNMKDFNVQENVDCFGLHDKRFSRQKPCVSFAETPQVYNFESPSKKPRQKESFNTNEGEKRKQPASGGLTNNTNPASSGAGVGDQSIEVRYKVSSPSEETFLRNKSKIEQFDVKKEKVSKSDIDLRTSKVENCSPVNANTPSFPEIYCPDAEFNDFEEHKAEGCFAVKQFWAIYDTTDALPRFYAVVRKVASPFNLTITWLEPDPDDQGEIGWHGADFPIACGKFRLGKSQRTADHLMFSHQIQCTKGSGKGSFLVYPQKGETWAIFRDWDINWISDPKKYLEYELEYVEILSDYAENVGIEVAFLGKVEGFVSLFQKTQKNGMNIFCVLPNELYRFSHRIPSYKMTGNERQGVPRGSFELDPAALPINLFKVGDYSDVKMENGKLNTGVEQLMANERINMAMMHGSSDAVRNSSILGKSPRGRKNYG